MKIMATKLAQRKIKILQSYVEHGNSIETLYGWILEVETRNDDLIDLKTINSIGVEKTQVEDVHEVFESSILCDMEFNWFFLNNYDLNLESKRNEIITRKAKEGDI